MEATHALAEACRKHGKHFIWDMGAPGKLEDMVRIGANVIMCGADTITLRDAASAVIYRGAVALRGRQMKKGRESAPLSMFPSRVISSRKRSR